MNANDKLIEFVREIADDSPITTTEDGEGNICRYCDTMWATGDAEEALGMLTLTGWARGDSGEMLAHPKPGKPWARPHLEDCLWVRAHRLLRSL